MSSKKSFHLRWNNHLVNLRTLLEFQYNEQSFVDVTISCSDGSIGAHKFVLSACSPYFDSIFRANPSKHPTLILRGISLREIQLLMEYMYAGSVDIPENELENLLQVANELRVKGLVQEPVEEDFTPDKQESPISIAHNQEFESENEMKESFVAVNCSSESASEDIHALKRDSQIENETTMDNNDKSANEIINMAQMKMGECVEEDNKKETGQNFKFEYTDGQNCYPPDLFCMLCKKGFLTKQNMKRHMQTHTGVKPHKCNLCNLSFLRLSHLQRHLRVHTGEKPFRCKQCERPFSRSDKLKQHIAQSHSGIVIPKQPKQRGRPRKMPVNETVNFTQSPNRKLLTENLENINNVPSYHTLQQIYNISAALPGISVIQ